MNEAKENLLEQAPVSQQKRFERFLNSPDQIKAVFDWFLQNQQALKDQKIHPSDFGVEYRIVGDPQWMENIFLVLPNILPNSTHLSLEQLRKSPELLYQIERMAPIPSKIDAMQAKRRPPFWKSAIIEALTVEQERNPTEFQSQADRLCKLLQLDSKTPQIQIGLLANNLYTLRRELLDQPQLYYYFLLQQSVEAIGQMAPRIGELLQEQVAPNVIFNISPDRESLESEIFKINRTDAYCVRVADRIGIRVQEEEDLNNLGVNHPYRMVVVCHEALHALSDLLFNVPPRLPGWKEREETHSLLPEEITRQNLQHVTSLGRIISEAISMAFENEMTEGIKTSTQDSGIADRLKMWQKKRIRQITDIKRQMARAKREQTNGNFPEGVVYAEGAEVAMTMKQNGWELDDLPEILEKVKNIISEENKDVYDGLMLEQIPFSHQPDSLYQRIIRQIRILKKV